MPLSEVHRLQGLVPPQVLRRRRRTVVAEGAARQVDQARTRGKAAEQRVRPVRAQLRVHVDPELIQGAEAAQGAREHLRRGGLEPGVAEVQELQRVVRLLVQVLGRGDAAREAVAAPRVVPQVELLDVALLDEELGAGPAAALPQVVPRHVQLRQLLRHGRDLKEAL